MTTSHDNESFPLVSIAIPTFNRKALLVRAIESALSQDYPHFELVISDNASDDGTESLCMRYAAADTRIKYCRQTVNHGPVHNFKEGLRQSSGMIFMWLADDDWIEPTYVSTCVEELRRDVTCSVVGGLAKYYIGQTLDRTGKAMNLESNSAFRRMLRYYSRVADNAIFYGLMWREQANLSPLLNVIGADWLFVAEMAYQGKVRTLQTTRIHRDAGGASSDVKQRGADVGAGWYDNRFPYFSIAKRAFRSIFRESPLFGGILAPVRLCFGCAVFLQILISKSIIQNLSWTVVHTLHWIIGEKNYRMARAMIRRNPS